MTVGYGKCIAFNRGRKAIRHSSQYGQKSGLTIELFTGVNQSSSVEYNGFAVFIINQTDLVYREETDRYQALVGNAILISTGTHTNMPISRSLIKKLSYPYSDCFQMSNHKTTRNRNQSYVDVVVQRLGTYARSHCLDVCILSQRKLLTQETTTDCNEDNHDDDKLNEFCARECPRECEKVSYEVVSTSSADYPSAFYKQILLANTDLGLGPDNDLSEYVASVSVFFDSDTYGKFIETPEINFTTLLANLGGQFGLFLGK